MKLYEVVLLGAIAAVAASAFVSVRGIPDEKGAAQLLKEAGYTEVEFHGSRALACGKGELYNTAFRGRGPTGIPTTGVVCKGLWSGAYIRR